jgi:hypothetical protein
VKKTKFKVFASFYETIFKNLNAHRNSLQGACSGFQRTTCGSKIVKLFQKPLLILKIVPKFANDMFLMTDFPASNERWTMDMIGENRPMTEMENRNRNSDAIFGTMFKIREGSKNPHIYFSLQQGSLKILNSSALIQKILN